MYNRYFGFLESPFSVTPDPRFFYSNPVYLEAYANLRYGIEAKKGFIAITGEVGTGKTTLLRKLMRNLPSSIHSVFIFNTDVSFNGLLRLILSDLGLPAEGKDRLAMIDQLNGYLLEQVTKGDIVCLLIDEVQNLSDESLEGLRLLSNLETDKEKLLQIVLMGQPELQIKLARPNLRQLRQRIAIQCEVTPLNDEEVGPYINFRLRVAGYQSEDLFERQSVDKITLHSKGIPRLINVICDNALLIAFAASQKTVSTHMIDEVARDLRLESETPADTKSTPSESVSIAEREILVREAPNDASAHKVTGMGVAAAGTLVAILAFVLLASFATPQRFFTMTVPAPETSQVNRSVQLVDGEKTIAQNANTKAKFANPEILNPTDERVIVSYGSTIYKIASDAYGADVLLGMDLIKEFNPEIKNLNWISTGQEILVPALTREILVRRQYDGFYHLIVASFLSRTEANESAGGIEKRGYRVVVVPRRVANDLVLHRLEIEGLKNLQEATRILETGLRNEWLTSGGQSETRNELGVTSRLSPRRLR
jgi:general secretion pathway protein A